MLWHLMHIISYQILFSGKNKNKYFKIWSAEKFTQHAMS